MSGGPSLGDALGTDSRCYARYTSAAAAELSSNDALQAAAEAWTSFVIGGHGDVFARLAPETTPEDLFVDALYFDFVVDRLIDRFERRAGVELSNRSAARDTDALEFAFHDLHDTITAAAPDGRGPAPPLDLIDRTSYGSTAGLLRELHESVVSTELRRLLGEYYTPRGIADLAVAELDVEDAASETMLDPGCGSGVFLAACIDAKLAALEAERPPEALVEAVTNTVYGIDLNPLAVKATKLVYLHALGSAIESSQVDRIELPVFLADSLGLTRDDDVRVGGGPNLAVDHLVGNPPWLTWGALDESVRDAWRETHVDRLDLLPHRGIETRLGHGNDDVSVPFVWTWIDRYLLEGGDASFVLKRDILTGPAGRLLRRGRVGSRPVAVRHVHDFDRLRPFGDDVAVNAAVYTFAADRQPSFPIPVDRWTSSEAEPSFAAAGAMRETLGSDRIGVVPVDDADPASSWIDADAERRAHGECDHEIRHGVKDDAAAVYTVDRDRLERIEHDHVYPYLRSKHVVKYGLFGHDLQLVPMRTAGEDNEAELRSTSPETYAYLDAHRTQLEERSSTWLDGGPFYNLFGLGPYTWSDYKVVWCRLGFKPHFAVVSTVDDPDLGEKPVVPGDHFMFVPTDDEHEAHFLCGLLNSAPYQRSIAGMASEGKASLSKAVVSELRLPDYRGTESERRLAERSMAAHGIVPEYTHMSKRAYNEAEIGELAAVQADIDALVERLLSTESTAGGGE